MKGLVLFKGHPQSPKEPPHTPCFPPEKHTHLLSPPPLSSKPVPNNAHQHPLSSISRFFCLLLPQMSAEFCAAAGAGAGAGAAAAVAMELGVGDVMGLQQGVAITAPSPSSDLGLLKRAALTQAAAAAPYPSRNRRCSEDAQVLQGAPSTNRRCSGSPRCSEDAQKMLRFCPLDEQKMLRFSKVAHTLPSGLHFGGPSEQQAFLLSRTKRPFTPSQWMELEHQALIYKYLNAKAPIPSSLLISISKSFRSSNRVSWRPLYQGYTNADADPEPGRCRRTDGKKWRCSKEAMADHKYCERHINRNRHRSRKPVENQPKKTTREVPAAAGSLPCAGPQGSLKKAKVNDSKPGTVSYWTDSLNGTMLSREKANKPTEDNSLMLNSTNSQPTLSLLSQLKQNNKPDKLGPTLENESNSDAILKAWGGNQPSHKSISSTQRHDAESLQSVLQNFSLAQNEKIESEKNKYSDSMLVSSTFYSAEGLRSTCLTPNMTHGQHDCISSSWEMPQGGPLGEILTNSKNSEDLSKCESRSYGWLLNLDHAP